ncbi:hypothetical protein LJC74_03045 [Eubacteriales bacterium OttesenSCG-928-A19]|nr:hypothetical protein [Eubacteriales bacterium OttesenSCG-928-A19]
MQELEAFFKVLLWACGSLITIGGAAAIIVKLFNPYKKLIARIDDLEKADKRKDDLLAKDLARFEANDERDRMHTEALFAILEHLRTNNSTGLMDETSKKMQAYLIHRK